MTVFYQGSKALRIDAPRFADDQGERLPNPTMAFEGKNPDVAGEAEVVRYRGGGLAVRATLYDINKIEPLKVGPPIQTFAAEQNPQHLSRTRLRSGQFEVASVKPDVEQAIVAALAWGERP